MMNIDRFDISREATKTLPHFCAYQRDFSQRSGKRNALVISGLKKFRQEYMQGKIRGYQILLSVLYGVLII